MTIEEQVQELSLKLDTARPELDRLDQYWAGRQPAAFMSKKSRDALQGGLRHLAVNFPRLAVESLVERLQVTGFQHYGDSTTDPELWATWRRCGLDDAAAQVHADALVYGRGFVLVWADDTGRPVVTVESPQQVSIVRDPSTRAVRAALKRWRDGTKLHAVLYTPDNVHRLTHPSHTGDTFPATGWRVSESLDNPFGVVPLVPFVNRGRLCDVDGVSEMSDVLDLVDALNKVTSDALVTSEYYARPRRWATGLELEEDEDGNVVNPFTNEDGRLWTSESPDTRFGQFDAAGVQGYTELMASLTQMIGAVSGLPPHYLGLNGDQPPSADSIRSAEASLVSRAQALMRTFGRSWGQVAALIHAVITGDDALTVDVAPVWASPETRTPAQQTDAAAKQVDMGVPLTLVLQETLGWSSEQVDRVSKAQRAEALNRSGVDLAQLVQDAPAAPRAVDPVPAGSGADS